jgi:2-hydroxy-3-oxopropionate reductase
MTAPHQRIGFIGLGVMGKPMASRLISAGYELCIYNRSRPAMDELVALGASAAGSVAEVARSSDVTITMLPDTPDVEAVMFGSDGIIAHARSGALVIDMSTISADASRRVAQKALEREVDTVDAPVSGGQKGAIEGTLSIMCGGTDEAIERARPIFAHLGSRVVHAGGPGAGQIVKACNQIVVGVTLQAMGEALVLGAKAGIAPEIIVDALSGGAARCWALDVRAPAVLQNDFRPGFRVALHHKDLGLALQTGATSGVPLPAASFVHEMFGSLIAMGRGDLDHSALITVIEDLANFHINGEAATE